MQSNTQKLSLTKKTVFTFGTKKGIGAKSSSGTTTVATIPTMVCATVTCLK